MGSLKMANRNKDKIKKYGLWFTLNLVIFVSGYLNYRYQLKHSYLYKTLNVGLCFSRAAAMVINFNLLLVWLPMCKFLLTRLSFLANDSLRLHEQKLFQLECKHPIDHLINGDLTIIRRFVFKLRRAAGEANRKLQYWICLLKLHSINSFLNGVDHCTFLHTICATTITIASVIHTVAHLMNVINFSNNFDPLLGDLNMAEHKGQNPLQLLISVPGITGILMVLILFLMSLSSMNIIRNSSFDLFQIFHRLSIIFVILLFLHPSSHVLKEQSNVDRHHPDTCYPLMSRSNLSHVLLESNHLEPNRLTQNNRLLATNATSSAQFSSKSEFVSENPVKFNPIVQGSSSSKDGINSNVEFNDKRNIDLIDISSENKSGAPGSNKSLSIEIPAISRHDLNSESQKSNREQRNPSTNLQTRPLNSTHHRHVNETKTRHKIVDDSCQDPHPLFVAQSSVCCYVLCVGLSCYLLDLILRKYRRSKTPIQLLNVRSDCEGNLIELVLNNNHKRFSYWLPGQFVYLNCPQIALFEWHPFTISSMDNENRQFTLHIKTGGDWTRRLRQELEYRRFMRPSVSGLNVSPRNAKFNSENSSENMFMSNIHLDYPVLPNFDCYNPKTGELEIQCTKLARITADKSSNNEVKSQEPTDFVEIDIRGDLDKSHSKILSKGSLAKGCALVNKWSYDEHEDGPSPSLDYLDLFIDGPFHSPFERLLDQDVSICVANGVGWTAFSSVFHCIANKLDDYKIAGRSLWSTQWRNYTLSDQKVCSPANNEHQVIGNRSLAKQPTGQLKTNCSLRTIRSEGILNTRLHLMIIVTSIEQLRPFYGLAVSYFRRINREFSGEDMNPIKEITAYLTRSDINDEDVRDFIISEKLTWNDEHILRVNEWFSIRFGKPELRSYLGGFSSIYCDRPKISVYCCGSYQVKKVIRDSCTNLNKMSKRSFNDVADSKRSPMRSGPIFSYHEENF